MKNTLLLLPFIFLLNNAYGQICPEERPAAEQEEELADPNVQLQGHRLLMTGTNASQGNWISLGPFSCPFPSAQQTVGSLAPGVGMTNAIVVGNVDSNIIYVGTPNGGLWKSTNEGNTWTALTDSLAKYGVTSLAIDPANDNKVYMLTTAGLFKTMDGGLSWTQCFYPDTLKPVIKIVVDPVNTQVLYLATYKGLAKSIDGGNTWATISGGNCIDLKFKPGTSTLYAIIETAAGANLVRSTNSGALFDTITPFNHAYAIDEIAVSAADSNYLYILAYDRVLISTDGGNSFRAQASSTFIPYATFNDLHHIACSPVNPNFLFFGGTVIGNSIDSGATWNQTTEYFYTSSQTMPYVHPDSRFIYFHGGSFWSCNDGGVCKTEDGGVTWINKTPGLAVAQAGDLSVSRSNPNVYAISCADNGTMVHYGNGWFQALGGDGQNVAVNPDDTLNILMTTQYGGIEITADGGNSATYGSGGITENAYGFQYQYPIRFNPQNSNSVFQLISNVWKSIDDGKTFTKISNFTDGGGGSFLYVHPTDSNVIYTGSYKTVDGGNSWSRFFFPSLLNGTLAVDPKNSQRIWYAGLNQTAYGAPYNYRPAVFYSPDAGNTFARLNTTGLPSFYGTLNIEYLDNGHDGLLLSIGAYVYFIDDRLSCWQPFMQGLPFCNISHLNFHPAAQKIRALAFGRGLWESSSAFDFAKPLQTDFAANKQNICPDDTIHFYDNSLNNGPAYHPVYSWRFTGGTPAFSSEANPKVVFNAEKQYDVSLRITNDNGTDSIFKPSFITVQPPPVVNAPVTEGFEGSVFPAYGWNWNYYHYQDFWSRGGFSFQYYGGYGLSEYSMGYSSNLSSGMQQDIYLSPLVTISSLPDPAVFMFDRACVSDSATSDTLKIFYTIDCDVTRHYLYSKGGLDVATTYVKTHSIPTLTPAMWTTDTINVSALKSLGAVQIGIEVNSYGWCVMFFDNLAITSLVPVGLVHQETQSGKLKVYPNPSNHYMNVIWNSAKEKVGVLRLVNLLGETVFREEITAGKEKKIQKDFSAGVYTMQCASPEGIESEKVIIMK